MSETLARTLLIACLALPAHAAPAAPPYAQSSVPSRARLPPLRIAMDQNYPPYSSRNAQGELEGYTVDLWRLWQQKTGRAVELVPANWAQVQPMLESGRADVIDPIVQTPARLARFDFSPPYGAVSTGIYAEASIGGIHDMGSLRGFEVGVQQGDACAEQLARAGVRHVRVFPSYDTLMAAAARRELKLLCLDENSADYHLYRLGLHRSYVQAFEVTRDPFRRAVRKGDAATLALVERGMAQISAAEREALRDKWMGRPLVPTRYT